MNKKYILDFKINEQVDSFFMLRKKNLKLTKHDKPYLEMTLSDKTGKIEGRLWDDADKFNEYADTGDVVHVKGVVDKFRESKQLKVDFFAKADERAFKYEDMVRVAESTETDYNEVVAYLRTIKNPWIKKIADLFVEDKTLMAALKEGVGGKSWHNAYIGGLLEHTYEVMCIANKMCELYPQADRDVTLFGAFIHDIGKVIELDAKKLEYTTEGGLLGHIAIGYGILHEKIREIPEFPKELSLRLKHIMLSHHGEYEQQSPVLPKTLEATIVYQTDDLVSQANAIKEIQLLQGEEGRVWSDYVFIKNRKYYIKDSGAEEWRSPTFEEKNTIGPVNAEVPLDKMEQEEPIEQIEQEEDISDFFAE
ncbi:MAG: HD domain-containing protein [Candidatus Omnitrophota bacterium]